MNSCFWLGNNLLSWLETLTDLLATITKEVNKGGKL